MVCFVLSSAVSVCCSMLLCLPPDELVLLGEEGKVSFSSGFLCTKGRFKNVKCNI